MSSTEVIVSISLETLRVGTLWFGIRREYASFDYDQSWLKTPGRAGAGFGTLERGHSTPKISGDPSLELSATPHQTVGGEFLWTVRNTKGP